MKYITRSLGEDNVQATTFTRQQNRAVLIAGLTCACFSVLATLITLRWFILMKRTFRHKLIMFLICSDTFKAFWYFIFPVVVFSNGPVRPTSGFCQTSGFFLSVGIEASDFAILMIALHSILYIFHPPAKSGEAGGLYQWRKFIYPLWLGLPILAASLAFVNHGLGYTTAGTFCYLPRRPFWYRLALSWIPRYFILLLILCMYIALYVYVTLKFRSFSNLQESGSKHSSVTYSRRPSMSDDDDVAPDESVRHLESPKKSKFSRPTFSRSTSYDMKMLQSARESNPWDEVSFITSTPLRAVGWQPGIQTADFAPKAEHGNTSGTASPLSRKPSEHLDPILSESRKVSNCPTTGTSYTGDTMTTATIPETQTQKAGETAQALPGPPGQTGPDDPLKRTRQAIRKQLRYLFIYPAVYVLMWLFPFVSHCLLYNDYYVQNPIFWLTIVSTCMFSLQAGVDCVIFSWREKPWRRVPEEKRLSFHSFRPSFSIRHDPEQGRSNPQSVAVASNEEQAAAGHALSGPSSRTSSRVTSANWWEAEGKKRKDSVWMGTDVAQQSNVPNGRRETFAQIPSSTSPVIEVDEPAYVHASRRPPAEQEESDRHHSWSEIKY